MRLRARTDGNHKDIVKALRQAGCAVMDLSRVGAGCPDLLVSRGGENWLLEVKLGTLPPSKRKRTPAQVKWHAAWRGRVLIVGSVAEALSTL